MKLIIKQLVVELLSTMTEEEIEEINRKLTVKTRLRNRDKNPPPPPIGGG